MRLQREGGLDVSAAATDTAMLRALDLAWTVLGRTSPNPPVGAVVVDTERAQVLAGAADELAALMRCGAFHARCPTRFGQSVAMDAS